MTRQLYICSGLDNCPNAGCVHHDPHELRENCFSGHCSGIEIMCIQYVPKEFNLKLEINND